MRTVLGGDLLAGCSSLLWIIIAKDLLNHSSNAYQYINKGSHVIFN